MKKVKPGIKSLRDLSIKELEKQELPEEVYKRCHYVLSENERLLKGCDLLTNGDIHGFGKLMYSSHEGLSKEYAVSCVELDYLVESARKLKGVAGARMMGGGFGGCTINLVKTENLPDFEKELRTSYRSRFNTDPQFYVTQIEDGARRIPGNS